MRRKKKTQQAKDEPNQRNIMYGAYVCACDEITLWGQSLQVFFLPSPEFETV